MSVEHGQNCLLYVGAGTYAATASGTVYSVNETAGVYTIERSSGDFTALSGAAVGQLLHVLGFTTNGSSFHGIIKAIATLAVTIESVVDDDGNDVTLVDETAGATITLNFESFNKVKGQRDTRLTGAGNSIDTSNKDTGGFGASIAGTRNQNGTVSGVINWVDTNGLEKLRVHWRDGTRPWCKWVLNAAGRMWFGQYAVTQFDEGGSNESATEYSLGLANSIKPKYHVPS
jgi:predicted secreted protein